LSKTKICAIIPEPYFYQKHLNKLEMDIKIIEHGSESYQQMIALRLTVLLHPIGIDISFINQPKEIEDVLIGVFEVKELIACCVLSQRGKAEIQLRQMAVATAHQGKKVGAALLQFAEKWAATNGFITMLLHARDVVIPFYQKNGYRIEGGGFSEVNIPHHVMKKNLNIAFKDV
jgi:GNAT superfamily N-acetyltransferase